MRTAVPINLTDEERATRSTAARSRTAPAQLVARTIVESTLHTTPRAAAHWSVRSLAKHLGVDKSMAQRVSRAHEIGPHRVRTFKLIRDRRFIEKLAAAPFGKYISIRHRPKATFVRSLRCSTGPRMLGGSTNWMHGIAFLFRRICQKAACLLATR